MVELFSLAMVTLAVVLYVQARLAARQVRQNRAEAAGLPPERQITNSRNAS
ncbi:hypothetical protein LCL97_10400 [Seohaeicola saemankumensis]|nr:hypothetical protein [Seohaeicola saemankumensis]MCA0871240.1 hypothetical protein [Seohaeicola saemankumensis]